MSSAFCENRVSAFTVSDNTGLVASSSLIYEDVTEEVCIRMCSDNRDNRGRTILCASFVYDHATFICTIYRSKGYPEGDLETEIAPGKRFFEKFCLAENVPADCADSQFLKADQSVIIGYAKNVSLATSIEDCIAQCLTEHFQCKSAMYFYKEGECITNTESAMTQPTSFAREETDKVIYIQNGCPAVLAKQKQLENLTASAESGGNDEDYSEDVSDETETTSHKTSTSDESDDDKVSNDDDKISNDDGSDEETTSIATTESATDESTLKQENDSEEQQTNDDNTEDRDTNNSFRIESTEPANSFEETTQATTIEKISKLLTRKLKKLRGESGIVKHDKNLKPIKETKLQRRIASEENEGVEKSSEEPLPFEVMPSAFVNEQEDAEKTNSIGKTKAEGLTLKPIKRLKIETMNTFEEEEHFSQWSNWSPCKKPGERRIRRRKCYNLRKCVGALMEIGECPRTVQDQESESREAVAAAAGSAALVNDEAGIAKHNTDPISPPAGVPFLVSEKTEQKIGAPPGVLPEAQLSEIENEPIEKVKEEVWSSWPGICQEFASGQPCKNHEIIGFESRECLAADHTKCKGPFFRYCTIPC